MKIILFLILGFFFVNRAFSQKTDSLRIYDISLTEHVAYLKSMSKKNIPSIYVERNDITDGLPMKINEVDVVYLTHSQIRKMTKRRQSVELIVILPVTVNQSSLKVGIIDFLVTSKKGILNYANGGGSRIVFTFNCDLQKFEMTSKHQGGI